MFGKHKLQRRMGSRNGTLPQCLWAGIIRNAPRQKQKRPPPNHPQPTRLLNTSKQSRSSVYV